MMLNRYSLNFALPVLLLAAASFAADDEATGTDISNPDETLVPVSEYDLEADVLEADTQAAQELRSDAEWLALEFSRFRELMNNGAFDEADTSAKRIIELAIQTKGAESNEMARALTNLAIVQHRTGDYEAAKQNYEAAIEIIEDVEDRLNAALVNPLKGLAAAQVESGRPDLASTTYRRAVHVTHVNEGPHNLDQIVLLEDLAEVQLRMGDIETAKELQDRIYSLNIRAFDTDSLAIVPSLMRRAKWQHRAGFIFDERATYRRIIRIVENELGRNALALVEPLVMLGKSFFYVDTSGATSFNHATISTGEIYFKRALRIAAESPESSWGVIADATLALADFYMYEGSPQRARQMYRNAWDLLSEPDESGDKLAKRRSELEEVVVLKEHPILGYIGETNPIGVQQPDDPVLQGTVTMSYGISTRGRTANLMLVEAQPEEFEGMVKSVHQELRRRIYRPRFADGEAVDTTDQVLIHTFYYRQSDLEALRSAADAEAT